MLVIRCTVDFDGFSSNEQPYRPLGKLERFCFWTISEMCKYRLFQTGLEGGPIRVVCSSPVKLSNSTVAYKYFFAPPQQNLCTSVATTAWWLSTWGWYQHYTTIIEVDPNKTMSTRPLTALIPGTHASSTRSSRAVLNPTAQCFQTSMLEQELVFLAWQGHRLPVTKILWAVVGMKL